MQLRRARVCLDCEEVHDAQSCPVCASEAFAHLSNWIQVEERRKTKRLPQARILRPTRLQRIVFGSGILGVLTYSVFRFARHLEEHALDRAGELR